MSTVCSCAMLCVLLGAAPAPAAATRGQANGLGLLPYPQDLVLDKGSCPLGPPEAVTDNGPSETERIALETMKRYMPAAERRMPVRLGSIEEGYEAGWLTAEQRAFLGDQATSHEASCVVVAPDGVTVVGKGKWGMLYGVQTVNQLTLEARRKGRDEIPCMTIRDWPDMAWRCLSPQLTWYSGWNRLEGYDCGNWTRDEWKWLVDWSLLHKCNAWAVCMYGYWPFRLPGYEEETLDVESYRFNPETGQKEPWRFTHPNVADEFYPEVIRYANARGVQVYAYPGKNSFNGAHFKRNPEIYAGGAAELLPFAPGVDEYWDAFLGRILELGFNGFVFEDPEANHVPNQNVQCYETFWKPWEKEYGFSSVEETDRNKPPLGVHMEYYTWLFRQFDEKIQRHGKRLGRDLPVPIYLITHVLVARMMAEVQDAAERANWFEFIDEKHGREVPFICSESNEQAYVDLLGGARVATLGGRGGSCTNAMRRIASINNNWLHGGMGGDIVYDIKAQQRMCEAGGMGAMGYIFEWTNTEVFGYIAAQYLWRNAGVPGIDSSSQTEFLDYAYHRYYGDEVGAIVARVMDEGSCVNDAMVLEGVYGSQWPGTGRVLHRDYQYLVVLADHAEQLARQAYKLWTGEAPDLYQAVYVPVQFRWDGYDFEADHLFKAERLRLLWVSTRRSQEMCRTALAHRLSQRMTAEGATVGEVLDQLDKALKHAKLNQRIYQINYYDDYDWTDGLCSYVTDEIEALRSRFLMQAAGDGASLKEWNFDHSDALSAWRDTADLTPPTIEEGTLSVQAAGPDPRVQMTETLALPVDASRFIQVEMASDRAGTAQVFWSVAAPGQDPPPYSEADSQHFEVAASEDPFVYSVAPQWDGELAKLRLDIPDNAAVRIRSIRIMQLPGQDLSAAVDRSEAVPESVGRTVQEPLYIPWEAQREQVPGHANAAEPGLYLSTDLGLTTREDYFRLGVVFTVEAELPDGKREMLFRRALGRRHTGWEHWDIPLDLGGAARTIKLRLVTDSYSRAQERMAPTWEWALWGEPQVVRVFADGRREVLRDLVAEIGSARPLVRLDRSGVERPFDGAGVDSTRATFRVMKADPVRAQLEELQQGEGIGWQWANGFGEWTIAPPHQGAYRHYLGSVNSGWVYAYEQGRMAWRTAPLPDKRATALAFVGGTNYSLGKAVLRINGEQVLTFTTGNRHNAEWESPTARLRYIHGADVSDERTAFGLSGLFVLEVPAARVTAGQPLEIEVEMVDGNDAWFMLHAYGDALAEITRSVIPQPEKPAIAAFTPHAPDAFGVTIGEFRLNLAKVSRNQAD